MEGFLGILYAFVAVIIGFAIYGTGELSGRDVVCAELKAYHSEIELYNCEVK